MVYFLHLMVAGILFPDNHRCQGQKAKEGAIPDAQTSINFESDLPNKPSFHEVLPGNT